VKNAEIDAGSRFATAVHSVFPRLFSVVRGYCWPPQINQPTSSLPEKNCAIRSRSLRASIMHRVFADRLRMNLADRAFRRLRRIGGPSEAIGASLSSTMRHRSVEGGGRHDPQGSCEVDRRKLGAWIGCAGDCRDRNRAVLFRQRTRRLMIWGRPAIAAHNGEKAEGKNAVNWLVANLGPRSISAFFTSSRLKCSNPLSGSRSARSCDQHPAVR